MGFSDDRLFLRDGPIDLIVQAWGKAAAVRAAYEAATARAATILDELCAEREVLRRGGVARGAVAGAMVAAVRGYPGVTPMAAVAGAVADAVLSVMRGVDRAFVNNGGDIAVFLAPGQSLVAGLVDRIDRPEIGARAVIRAGDGVGGIATSGWRGRSFSLGIADAATVLAADAAGADAAATVIGNACDLPGHAAVTRVPACSLVPDSDLGDRLVTRAVGDLTPGEVGRALDAAEAAARPLVSEGRIVAAAIVLAGRTRIVGQLASLSRSVPGAYAVL